VINKISTMFMSKHNHLQKILFGEIVFDSDCHKLKEHMLVHQMIVMILIVLKYIRYIMF
jgi:hypothetical protein